jgi:DNA-binding transcriptional LysR family regulator
MDAHLRDLRYFVAVAEELSFTKAANERLFIAQPTLSRQIRLLEAALRAKLFERDHRTVRLTKAAEVMLTGRGCSSASGTRPRARSRRRPPPRT